MNILSFYLVHANDLTRLLVLHCMVQLGFKISFKKNDGGGKKCGLGSVSIKKTSVLFMVSYSH